MKTLLASAVIALSTAAAVQADQVVLSEALAGATLHEAGIDMSIYYTEAETGLAVVATYVPQDATNVPARLAMLLQDGDKVSFGLPGQRGVIYSFARNDADVTVTADRIGTQYAQR